MSKAEEGRATTGRPSSVGGGVVVSWAPMDAALTAYRAGDASASLTMDTDVGGPEDVPVSLFFRGVDEMGPVESEALRRAAGRVLDFGAGVGAHARPLQDRGLVVTAVEVLPAGRAAMAEMGLRDVRAGGLESVRPDERFDTVLVLMNGLGLAGSLGGLPGFLEAIAEVVAPGGQILADSTDPRGWDDPDDGRYPGEVHMQLRYGDISGPPFPFLFVDPDAVAAAARSVELEARVIATEEEGRFLVRINRG